MEKRAVLKASTPGGHPVVLAVWLAAAAAFVLAAALFAFGSFAFPAVALVALGWLLAGWLAYLVRHARFERALRRAEARLGAGDLEGARTLVAPLLARYPGLAPVQRVAGLVLYAAGDPLSAASLLERAARRRRDRATAVALVASYAALNKAGDARRAARALPDDPDVQLALAWSELVALGGDRARGAALIAAAASDTPARAAMAASLRALVAARSGGAARARPWLQEAEGRLLGVAADDRAFLLYLRGVTLREAGDPLGARRAFSRAIEAAPGTIGEALARRERAHIPESGGSSVSPSSPIQPSSD